MNMFLVDIETNVQDLPGEFPPHSAPESYEARHVLQDVVDCENENTG